MSLNRFHRKIPAVATNVRLAAQGTRVVVIRPDTPQLSGTISNVRTATNLRPYVVTCDDGSVVFMSAYDLALEADTQRTPLAPRPVV